MKIKVGVVLGPHSVLVNQSLPSLCRVDTKMWITCLVEYFNMITIKEIHAYFEEDKVNCEL